MSWGKSDIHLHSALSCTLMECSILEHCSISSSC